MWVSTWPGGGPVEHETERQAEDHGTEVVRSGMAEHATAYWHTETEESR